ncbi:MAG: proline--tRNA ligase, partial [Coriobacteriales bacterium]|nr:proline--tRNA ligase [Coriobacteriales bacterium]
LLYCDCGFAANAEVAHAHYELEEYLLPGAQRELTKIHTPGVATMDELADFLGIGKESTVKALAARDNTGRITVLLIPGNHELAPLKTEKILPSFEFLTDAEMETAGIVKGFLGPVGLPEDMRIVADASLQKLTSWLVGANEKDYHLAGAQPARDFEVDLWADIAEASAGDSCPVCALPLKGARGIEVGQVFQLGTKYSESMNATYMDVDGAEKHFLMGCYGWGITRCIAAIVEQSYDEQGIIWPLSVAPAEVVVIPLSAGDDAVSATAAELAEQLVAQGIEVALDDRDERAGVKFNDADLIGWPYQLIIGKRGLEAATVELKTRATGDKLSLPLSEAVNTLAELVKEQRKLFL